MEIQASFKLLPITGAATTNRTLRLYGWSSVLYLCSYRSLLTRREGSRQTEERGLGKRREWSEKIKGGVGGMSVYSAGILAAYCSRVCGAGGKWPSKGRHRRVSGRARRDIE